MEETIYSDSNVGKRLSKLKRVEAMYIVFNGREIPLVSKIIIGRSRTCDITVDDSLASRQHALIQKIKSAYFIKDLGSTNGTFVNGSPVPSDNFLRLKANDVIVIGRTELSLM